jgi:hypothetical protein
VNILESTNNGSKHGTGTLVEKDTFKYKGDMKYNKMEGKGKIEYSNGDTKTPISPANIEG